MSDKFKTVRITATMEHDLELFVNVPEHMTDEDVYQKVREGEIDGGDMTEVAGSGGWTWNDASKVDFKPEAGKRFEDFEAETE